MHTIITALWGQFWGFAKIAEWALKEVKVLSPYEEKVNF
jgi:hypothetical protein